MSKVSCVIPYYNAGETIARAIDSVVHNALCAEVVVVVDASPQVVWPHLTPHHLHLVEEGRLRVIELATNLGPATARNIGASVSVAPYLSFLDADDVFLHNYYDLVVPALEARPEIAAIEVGAEIVRGETVVLDAPDPRYYGALNSAPWNLIVRRGGFWASGAFPVGNEFRTQVGGEDIVFKAALKRAFTVLHSPNKLIRHYVRDDSAILRYLKRTAVVDGAVVWVEGYDDSVDGLAQRAGASHLARAEEWLASLRALAPAPPTLP